MDDYGWARPTLSLLTAGQIKQVHAYALRILQETGLRVDSERARRAFAAADGVTVTGDRVTVSVSPYDMVRGIITFRAR